MDLVAIGIGLLVTGLGITGLGIGGKSLWQWRQLGASDPVPIRDAIVQSGAVEIEGDVRPHESTLESPHFREECVAYEYKTEKRRRRRSSNGSSRTTWRTIDSGQTSCPFIVADDSGTAYVDPDGASFSLETERTQKTNDQGEPIPDDRTLNLNLSVTVPGLGTLAGNNRRFTEKRLPVGNHCYVVGETDRPPAGIDADVSIVGTGDSMFLLSDATESETRRRLLLRGAGYAVAGLVGTVAGVGILGAELL